MWHIRFLLSIVCILIFSSLVWCAQEVELKHTSVVDLFNRFSIQSPPLLSAQRPPVNQLNLVHARMDRNQVNHIRLEQRYMGYRVFRGYGVLHTSQTFEQVMLRPHGAESTMNGRFFDNLEQDIGFPSAQYEKFSEQALEHFLKSYTLEQVKDKHVEPIVFVDSNRRAHWAYWVSAVVVGSNQLPKYPTAILSASHYKTFIEWDSLKTQKVKVKGIGFGGNKSTDIYQYGVKWPLLNILRNKKNKLCYMANDFVNVVDMKHQVEADQKTMTFSCPKSDKNIENAYWTGYLGDGFDPENGAYSPANDALYAGEVVQSMYNKWYRLEVLNRRGRLKPIVIQIHYGKDVTNAFWDGKQLVFGDGGLMTHPLVSVGIAAHELSHGFTEKHSGLFYLGESGGINESFSDMASQAAELYVNGAPSWRIGKEVIKSSSKRAWFRDMEHPSRDGHSIERADQFEPQMNVHYSSGVFNRFFYLLANTPEWDAKKAFGLMLKANMDYWTPYSSFQEAGCGVIRAAKDLKYSIDDVKRALIEVAIDTLACT